MKLFKYLFNPHLRKFNRDFIYLKNLDKLNLQRIESGIFAQTLADTVIDKLKELDFILTLSCLGRAGAEEYYLEHTKYKELNIKIARSITHNRHRYYILYVTYMYRSSFTQDLRSEKDITRFSKIIKNFLNYLDEEKSEKRS